MDKLATELVLLLIRISKLGSEERMRAVFLEAVEAMDAAGTRELLGDALALFQAEREAHYRLLVDNQAGLVFTASLDGVIRYASPQTLLLFGCDASSWVGRPLADLVAPGSREETRRRWAAAVCGETAGRWEAGVGSAHGGKLRWVAISLALQPARGGAPATVIGSMWDLTERRAADERLQHSEQEFRSAWESSADGMRLADGQGVVLRVNEGYCRIFGRRREDIEGRPLGECYGETERERIERSYRGRYPDGFAGLFEAEAVLWNGQRKWLEVSNSLLPRPGGPVVLSIFRDITQRKATEARLSVLARAIEQSPTSVVVTDTQGRIEYVNPKFCRLTGFTLEEARGQNPRILKSGLTSPDVYRSLWATITAGQEWHGELLNRRRDGTMFWEQASISPVKNSLGEVTHYVAVKEDITERKRVQQALEESERRFREMLERVELLAVLLDTEGRVTFCNDYLCRVTGWTSEQLMGRAWLTTMIPAGAQAEPQRGAEPHSESEILTADGRRLLIAWDHTPLRGPSGEPAGTASLGRDITSQRMLEEQYRQAQKLESLGRLAGGVAHDFNNLLTVINGYSEMMMDQFEPLDPMHLRTREIFRAGQRAAELTKQLLAFSRKQMIERKVVQLNDLIQDTERLLQRLIGEEVRLELHLDAGLGRVEADSSQIHQVLMNLAVNARDAMPRGGVLRIETAPLVVADGLATDWDLPPGAYVRMTVSDTGLGMDSETKKHAFEPFFTTKGVDRGTGLGLATVYGIVKQHGGGIQMESRVGEGATFRIAIPVCDKALAAEVEAVARPRRGAESVLLVEDQPEVRRLAARMLTRFGYDVCEAGEGAEALELAAGRKFDLLLTDMVMPNMRGHDLAQQLRRIQPAIRVLFMSGYAEHAGEDALDGRAANFLAKPFSSNALGARVREVLDA